MNARERVLLTLNHQDADRPPTDLMGAACSLNDGAYFRLLDHLGMKGDVPPFRRGTTSNYYDERVLERLGVDFRRLMLRRRSVWPVYRDETHFTDEWGISYVMEGAYPGVCGAPLADATSGDLRNYHWPRARDVFDPAGLAEQARRLYEETGFALVARMPCWGLFDMAAKLRGMEQLLVDLLLEPELVAELLEYILSCQMDFYGLLLDQVGPYVQMVETCDDLGSQNGLLFSREIFRTLFAPVRSRLNDFLRQKAPEAKIFLHCCGAVFDLIPELLDTGVDVLNPIQPNAAGMDPAKLKEAYGDRLCFHGGIDTQHALRGSTEDVAAEVTRKLDLLYRGGGYIIAPANHIMDDVPPENTVALYEAARQWRRSIV